MANVIRTLLVESYPEASEPLRLRTGEHELDPPSAKWPSLRDKALRSGEAA